MSGAPEVASQEGPRRGSSQAQEISSADEQGAKAEGLGPAADEGSGLSSQQAATKLAQDGPNAIPESKRNPLLAFLSKLWGPIPWLLEAAIVLELGLGNYVQALVIAILVALDATLAFREEGGAQEALELLRQRLEVQARVKRDGTWQELPASQIVQGDLVHVRQGDLVPADLEITSGEISLDQSALTGESLAVTSRPGSKAYSGSLVVRGEATGNVLATGQRTYFGRTAELVGTTHAPGRLEQLIMGFVKALLILDVGLAVLALGDGFLRHLGWQQLLPFVVILVVAAVPIALPTTFTLASALGARELAGRGVLVTHLAAIEEAASMEVLCTDKTGTITQNTLAVDQTVAFNALEDGTCNSDVAWDKAPAGKAEQHGPAEESAEKLVLQVAAAASDPATQDPLDLAILQAAREKGIEPLGKVVKIVPFSPQTKRCEVVLDTPHGTLTAIKGAPQVLARMCDEPMDRVRKAVDGLARSGARVLGVAEAQGTAKPRMIGLVAMADPPRPDSAKLVADLHDLGVRVVMVTGDSLATGRAIAEKVGIGSRACPASVLRDDVSQPAKPETPKTAQDPSGQPRTGDGCDVYAEVLPEDKLRLVDRLQKKGFVVGMTGDGVNDAPALSKAEVGVAVANATDVAKAAASLVLTTPGLDNLVRGVEVSRRIHERMLTYTLNKIVKTLQVSFFLSLGLLIFGRFVTTPLLVVLLLLANNFATMSLATDHVGTPKQPERWSVKALIVASVGLAVPLIVMSFGLWLGGDYGMGLHTKALQTLTFLWLVSSAQATIYSVRERRHFWSSAPSLWLAGSSIADLVVVGVLAWRGWLMTQIDLPALALGIGAGVVYLFVAEAIKGPVFHYAGLSGRVDS
jgi:H+-transporting ATPase